MPEKRSFYEKLAANAGFEPVDAVTKDLALLVAADPAANGGKLAAARKNGIRIIALDEFLKLAADAAPAAEAPPVSDDLFGNL